MFMFWIAAALLAGGAGGGVLHRARRATVTQGARDPAIGVYRRALAEIDDLAQQGLIGGEERRATHAEAARRLLSAADQTQEPIIRTLPHGPLMAAAAAGPMAALILYFAVGSPGAPDQPFALRLAAWRGAPERYAAPELAAVLRSLASQRPADPEPWRRLAALDLSLGDPDGAAHALRKALVIAPGRPELLEPLGEILVLKARGKVDADAQAVFRQALRSDPQSLVARYELARVQIEEGDAAEGLARWRSLLGDLPSDDLRRSLLARDIKAVERTGRPAPEAEVGPGQASELSGAIQAMVDGLAARLRAHPDDPQGWVRLVRAYSVLGESAKRDAALARARRLYGGRPGVLGDLNAALRSTR
jgi:cytochrome c-type biogenesis protein CcmH